MKYWLTRLYPRSWRRRYEAEFHALLEQHSLSVWDVFDILCGALDAHWTAISTQQGHTMFTMTFSIRRRTIAIVMAVLLGYILSYGACRTVGLLVHSSQNRYTALSRHTISATGAGFARPTAPLALFYTPLRLVESAAWPIVDAVTQSRPLGTRAGVYRHGSLFELGHERGAYHHMRGGKTAASSRCAEA